MSVCPMCHQEINPRLMKYTVELPKGCVCDPYNWFGEVTAICASFAPFSEDEPEICIHCEHTIDCHSHAPETPDAPPVLS